MMLLIYAMQFLNLLLGCSIASFHDIKKGIVKNGLILTMLTIGLALNLANFFAVCDFKISTLINDSLLVILLSVILYLTHIWAGGDAKLLIAIVFAFPYGFITKENYPLWMVIVYAFAVGIVYLFFESVVLSIRKNINFELKDVVSKGLFQLRRYIKMIIYMSVINYLYMYFIEPCFTIPVSLYTVVCFAFIWLVEKTELLNSKTMLFFCTVFDVGMYVITGFTVISTNFQTYITIAVFILMRLMIENFNYETVMTSSIKKGMVLSRVATLMMQNSKIMGLPSLSNETLASRISESEAESVRRWGETKNGHPHIVIVRKIPFAIFISLGLLIYILVGRVA